MSEAPLLRSDGGGIMRLTMNRPDAHNSFTVPMIEALQGAMNDAARDPQVKVVVVTGAGKAFSAGQDLREHMERKPAFLDHLRERYNPLIARIRSLPKPVIAAINGTAAGAGMSLALACDFRLCTPETKFYTSFIKIGLVPDSGNLLMLGKLAGFGRALEHEMLGKPIEARQALEWGLVNRIAPLDKLMEETAAFAQPLVEGPSQAIALTKQMYNKVLFAKDLESHLDEEALLQEVAGRTQDHAEGIKAFVEKRAPQFTGR